MKDTLYITGKLNEGKKKGGLEPQWSHKTYKILLKNRDI